jgi:hypothetical protein
VTGTKTQLFHTELCSGTTGLLEVTGSRIRHMCSPGSQTTHVTYTCHVGCHLWPVDSSLFHIGGRSRATPFKSAPTAPHNAASLPLDHSPPPPPPLQPQIAKESHVFWHLLVRSLQICSWQATGNAAGRYIRQLRRHGEARGILPPLPLHSSCALRAADLLPCRLQHIAPAL